MRHYTVIFLILAASLCIVSCSGKQRPEHRSNLKYKQIYDEARKQNEAALSMRENEMLMEKKAPRKPVELEPLAPTYNPLDEVEISITMRDQPLADVLYVVARNAGMNLVVEPEIDLENTVTISFESAKSSTVMESLLAAYDLSWEVKDNLIQVKRFVKKSFDLGFLNTTITAALSNGGDIFGQTLGGGGGGGGLTGAFQVESEYGQDDIEDSLYGFIETAVGAIVTDQQGIDEDETTDSGEAFSVDRVSGRLYAKTTPSKMEAIEELISDLRRKMTRQVIIDARIIEVQLADGFDLGVDWNYVTNRLISGGVYGISVGSAQESSPNIPFSLTFTPESEALNYDRTSSLSTTIDVLETFGSLRALANPHVRALHSQPTLLTSGESISYVSEIGREQDDETGDTTFTVDTATVFDGVMLGVIPHISDEGVVDLQIFPVQSSVDEASLELVDVSGAGDRITLPRLEVKNVSTTVKVRDGDMVILGGLIDKSSTNSDSGIPGAATSSYFDFLFNQRSDTESLRELVIIMNIRVVE